MGADAVVPPDEDADDDEGEDVCLLGAAFLWAVFLWPGLPATPLWVVVAAEVLADVVVGVAGSDATAAGTWSAAGLADDAGALPPPPLVSSTISSSVTAAIEMTGQIRPEARLLTRVPAAAARRARVGTRGRGKVGGGSLTTGDGVTRDAVATAAGRVRGGRPRRGSGSPV